MSGQLALPLPVRPALERADFFVSPANSLALAALDRGDWPQGKFLLTGPEGAGKSHLARVWARDNSALILNAGSLTEGELPDVAALVVEDADRIAGDRAAETRLFHLHNHVLARQTRLLLTARAAPGHWPLALPDLKSRMEGTAQAVILPPDDALLAAVLIKQFSDRQLSVAPRVVDWLVRRIDRTFGAAQEAVARLDAASLARGRAITLPFAAEVLDMPAAGAQ